jgi:hypothetical protein
MNKAIKIISKISVFSFIGTGLNIFLIYTFLMLWLNPQESDIELIYSLTILVLFEFVLVHSGAFMSILGRSWKGWLGFGVFYGLFALAFNAMVNGNQIIIFYAAVVLNRMLPGILNSEKTNMGRGAMMAMINATIYLVLIFAVILGSSYIPRCGLTETFLNSVDYASINKAGGDFAGDPHIFMCFGVFYYLILMLVDINAEIHRIKAALAVSINSRQSIKKESETEKDESKSAIFRQLDKNDNELPPGCGCSPWLVFVLAAVFIAIGVYQYVDNVKVEKSGVIVTSGIVSGASSSTIRDKKTNSPITTYQISVTFTAEGKEYTITQDYFSDANIGDTISVEYFQNSPHKAVVAGTGINQNSINIFLWIGIIIIIVFTGLILIGKLTKKGK